MEPEKQSGIATLMHLIKSCLGTGVLSMPLAFQCTGMLVGVLGLIFAALVCTHCVYVLVANAQELRKTSEKIFLTYPDVAEETFKQGPKSIRKYHSIARRIVDIGIFTAYFTVCSAYTVIIATTLDKFVGFYMESLNIRIYILVLLIPLLLICFIPNWKYLTPVSVMSNIFMATGLCITLYYLLRDIASPSDRKLVANISTYPKAFGIAIFSLQAIGAAMPLENRMKRPENFLGIFGILNIGLIVVTLGYMAIGFLGYLKFGETTMDNITLNLPGNEYAAQIVQILIGLSVMGTFGVQFFISFEIIWSLMKDRYQHCPIISEYIFRTVLVVIAVGIALAIPTIGPFVSLIDTIMCWNDGYGRYSWILIKNMIVMVTGVLALVFGTIEAVRDIVKLYEED